MDMNPIHAESDAHTFSPSRPGGTVCVASRENEFHGVEVCGYPATHPIHRVDAPPQDGPAFKRHLHSDLCVTRCGEDRPTHVTRVPAEVQCPKCIEQLTPDEARSVINRELAAAHDTLVAAARINADVPVPAEGSRERTMERRFLLRGRLQQVAVIATERGLVAAAAEIEKILDEVLRIPTPAEAVTGVSDRRAAALGDVAALRRKLAGAFGAGSSWVAEVDRIEAALREGTGGGHAHGDGAPCETCRGALPKCAHGYAVPVIEVCPDGCRR